ncbi:hypothetical protein RhiirC2_714435 [Rhizophagus irregularis]|uniref:Uncharacterized protein n=1 Tax=Rhizophagus irregularis TaxID=588596 RepID=A0A2N1MZJ6_9GLOM|nr:hypothetical protein RhiirC2_714435 [Rhizophagus irregularis]
MTVNIRNLLVIMRQQRLTIKQLKQNTKSNNLNRNETERNEEIPKARRKSKSYTKNSFSELKQKRLIIKQLKQNTKNNNLNRDETERNDTSQTDTSSQNKTIWTQTPLPFQNEDVFKGCIKKNNYGVEPQKIQPCNLKAGVFFDFSPNIISFFSKNTGKSRVFEVFKKYFFFFGEYFSVYQSTNIIIIIEIIVLI